MLANVFVALCRFAPARRLLWRTWYDFLAGRYRENDWNFMNYGYLPALDSPRVILDTAYESERYCAQLYHFVASAADLEGKHVLEVGSGRGGGANFVKRHLKPATMTGVDFSAAAVELARGQFSPEGLTFRQGNAEALPFKDESFDAVLNIESSHCYGSMPAFLSEVRRVLKPGGTFLYADLRSSADIERWRSQLLHSGMTISRAVDITPNVLAALDADHSRKTILISKLVPKPLRPAVSDFAGIRGSAIHEGFRTGRLTYRAFRMEKP